MKKFLVLMISMCVLSLQAEAQEPLVDSILSYQEVAAEALETMVLNHVVDTSGIKAAVRDFSSRVDTITDVAERDLALQTLARIELAAELVKGRFNT